MVTPIDVKGETLAQKKISDLKERVRITNETDGAILLSIHQNHFPDPKLYGAQVFYAKTAGSEALAEHIQNLIVSSVNPGSRRRIKQSDGVYLMTNIKYPGVLIECGFLSNPAEAERLYELFLERAQAHVRHVGHGRFGADMKVSLLNDGPVTIVMESDVLKPAAKG